MTKLYDGISDLETREAWYHGAQSDSEYFRAEVIVVPYTGTRPSSILGEANNDAFSYLIPEGAEDDWVWRDASRQWVVVRDKLLSLLSEEDPEAEDMAKAILGLHDYPVLSESLHSEYEHEAAEEAWESYGRNDLQKAYTTWVEEMWEDDAWRFTEKVDLMSAEDFDELAEEAGLRVVTDVVDTGDVTWAFDGPCEEQMLAFHEAISDY